MSRPTLQTIADHLSISRSTVSRVLGGTYKEYGISDKTAKLILARANEINYIRDERARSLRIKKTLTIGVIVRDITNLFYSQIVKKIENELFQKGYTVIISNTNYNLEKEHKHIEVLLSRKVDGIIISPIQSSYDNILMILEQQVPLILFDCKIEGLKSDFIVIDNEESAKEGVKHLISLGHEKIAYIGGHSYDLNNKLRFRGYKKALEEAGIPIHKQYIKHGSYTFRHGHEAAKQLLILDEIPAAFFVANNRIVLGAYKSVLEMGMNIPNDISILGFDDFETATMLPSPLTVIRQPIEEMATEAVNLLISRINGDEETPFLSNVLKTELILRSSTKGLD